MVKIKTVTDLIKKSKSLYSLGQGMKPMRSNHIILLGSSLHKKYVKLSEDVPSLDAKKFEKQVKNKE